MKLSTRNLTQRHQGGFTLMELLVVITIILILAGMTFPVARGVQAKARKTAVKNSAVNLKNAISTYYTEYRRYPVDKYGTDEKFLTDNTLMDVLLGADDNKLNPRRTVFYNGKQAQRGPDNNYISGVRLGSGGTGQLYDAWGEYYRVFLDLDNNSRVKAPSWARGDVQELPESILVWSAGPDMQDDGNENDNIATFQ